MKKIFAISVLIITVLYSFCQNPKTFIENGVNSFINPLFAGDYPDPSILRDGNTYYIVHSSFEYYPGLLIWKSTDLINWTPVTNALHKNIGSVWAPDLVKYNNKFYIYFPANNSNYVVYADSINGKWSEPIDLKVGNIDPGHITDNKGNRFLFFSNGGYVPLSKDGLQVIGEYTKSYNGWEIPKDWTIECFCMEGPKLVKHNDYYYLTVAEGGTAGPATGHMVISARSKSINGPWENSPYNPIIRTTNNNEQWWSKGHGTIFEDAHGKWWIVFHAYENGYYNMGRQTLLLPVEWTKDGWYKIPEGITTENKIPFSYPSTPSNYKLSDSFSGNTLQPQWKFFGDYDTTRFKVSNNSLEIKAKGNSVSNCSPLLCVPANHSYTADIELQTSGNAIGGMVLFYNTNAFSGILADSTNILANLRGWQFPTVNNVITNTCWLRIKNTKNTVDMFYSLDGSTWIKIQNSAEVSAIHHNVLGGFLSLRIGLCAMGEGSVIFKNFTYTAIE